MGKENKGFRTKNVIITIILSMIVIALITCNVMLILTTKDQKNKFEKNKKSIITENKNMDKISRKIFGDKYSRKTVVFIDDIHMNERTNKLNEYINSFKAEDERVKKFSKKGMS